jgi:hypothetical protein
MFWSIHKKKNTTPAIGNAIHTCHQKISFDTEFENIFAGIFKIE